MRSVKHALESKWIDNLIGFTVVIYPFLFIWQGGDLTDTGYEAIYNQNVFRSLIEGVLPPGSKWILTCLIGGIWMKLFPSAGILGLRLLEVLFIQGMLFCIYRVIKELGCRRVLLLGLLCGEAFALRFSAMALQYDTTSAFFLILTVVFIWKAMQSGRAGWFFGGGIAASLAILSRIPNVLIIPFMLIVFIYYNWFNAESRSFKKKAWKTLNQYAWFLAGAFLSVSIFLAILKMSGLLTVYVQNLFYTAGRAHTLKSILVTYAHDIYPFILYVFVVLFAALTLSYVDRFAKKKWLKLAVSSLFVLWAIMHFYGDYSYGNSIKYFVPAVCILPVFFALRLDLKVSPRWGSLVLMVCMVALLGVSGTCTGLFLKLNYGILFLIPLVGTLAWKKRTSELVGVSIRWRPILKVAALIVLFMSVLLRIGWIYHVRGGLRSRLLAIHPVEHKLMRGILTTKDRAAHINAVMRSVNMHLRDDNSLFIYGHEPLFYYLSEKVPPVRIFWMANRFCPAKYYFTELNAHISRTGLFPLVLITDRNVLGGEGARLMDEFLEKEQYRCVEQMEGFEVWNKSEAGN